MQMRVVEEAKVTLQGRPAVAVAEVGVRVTALRALREREEFPPPTPTPALKGRKPVPESVSVTPDAGEPLPPITMEVTLGVMAARYRKVQGEGVVEEGE